MGSGLPPVGRPSNLPRATWLNHLAFLLFNYIRCTPRAVASLLIVALVMPSPHVPWFDGIPIGVVPEILAIAFCIAWATIPARWTLGRGRLSSYIAILAMTGIALKLILLFAPSPGFQACYKVLSTPVSTNVLEEIYQTNMLTPTLNSGCEKSYDAPFAADYSRYDDAIDFGPKDRSKTDRTSLAVSNWDLTAVNSLYYSYAPATKSDTNRDRLAFSATWKSNLDPGPDRVIRYVGEGSIRIGALTIELPPSYQDENLVSVPLTASGALLFDYKWAPGGRLGAEDATAPYGEAHLEGKAGVPVAPAEDAMWPMILALAFLATVFSAFALQTAGIIGFLRCGMPNAPPKDRRWVFPVSVIAVLVILLPMWRLRGLSLETVTVVVILVFLLLTCLLVDRHYTRFLAFVVIPPAAVFCAALRVPDFASVTYRTAMDDFLVYESYAREILSHGDLRGGEDVFIYSPAIRYFLFGQHLIFGDHDPTIFVLFIIGVIGSCWFAINFLLVTRLREPELNLRGRKFALVVSLVSVVVVGLVYGSSEFIAGGLILLSEYPTWILLTIAFPLVFFGRGLRSAVVASALMSLSLTFRGNQLPGISVMLLVLLLRQSWPYIKGHNLRKATQSVMWVLAPFVAVSALPGLHNYYFGGQLVLLQTSLASSYILTPAQLLQITVNSDVSRSFLFQLGGVLASGTELNSMVSGSFLSTLRVVQASLIGISLLGLIHFYRRSWRATLLTAVPAVFLATHLFVQVDVYYPRHIMMGYAMGVLTLVALGGVFIDRGRWATLAPGRDLVDAQERVTSIPVEKP